MAPNEYGFYANVNPEVDHPRWSQAKERRIGEFLKRKTLPFNGYAEQVAHLYAGMDLSKALLSSSAAARRLARAAVLAGCCLPLAVLVLDAARGRLGANPIEAILNRFGFWTLVFLLLSLVPTPLRILTGWGGAIRYRRTIGLFAFFYALPALRHVRGGRPVLRLDRDLEGRRQAQVHHGRLRRLPAARARSRSRRSDAAVRRLGFVRWKRWHRLVYVSAVLGVIHFVWRVKADLREPLVFAAALAILLAIRVVELLRRRPAL